MSQVPVGGMPPLEAEMARRAHGDRQGASCPGRRNPRVSR